MVSACTPYPANYPSSGTLSPSGNYHTVSKGETLWSISKRYGIELSDLVEANRISDASQIEVGQRLAIPRRGTGSAAPRDQEPISVENSPEPISQHLLQAASGPVPGDSGDFVWPVDGRVISIFGSRRKGNVNKGVDIQAPGGSDVRAARSGRVSFVHEALPGFGKTIIVEHPGGFATVYAYIDQILVRSGEPVAQRQVIARVGKTGRTEVPALHFEIRRRQKPQNPLYYLP
jgi:murein DD-endopeptidase MepM/ murein hydrolase activator NlpD